MILFSLYLKGELNSEYNFLSFEYLGIVEQLCEVFFKGLDEQ